MKNPATDACSVAGSCAERPLRKIEVIVTRSNGLPLSPCGPRKSAMSAL